MLKIDMSTQETRQEVILTPTPKDSSFTLLKSDKTDLLKLEETFKESLIVSDTVWKASVATAKAANTDTHAFSTTQ